MLTIVQALASAIRDGVYPPHTRLPSERELARRYTVPASVVRGAFRQLSERGLVYRIERGGTFVCGESSAPTARKDSPRTFPLHCINFIEPERGQLDPFAFVLSDYLHGYTRILQRHPLRVRFASIARKDPCFETVLNPAMPADGQACIIGDCLSPELARWLTERGMPFVFRRFAFYDTSPYPPHHGVYLNRNAAGLAATQHLMKLGHARIAFIGPLHDETGRQAPPPDPLTPLEWCPHVNGYRAAFCIAGRLPPDGLQADVSRISPPRIREATARLLQQADRPTAFVCGNDAIALEVMRVASDLGLSVPGDVSVIGFDNDPAGAEADPPLTTFGGHEALAVAAIERLFALVEEPALEPAVTPVECPLIRRASTAPPPETGRRKTARATQSALPSTPPPTAAGRPAAAAPGTAAPDPT